MLYNFVFYSEFHLSVNRSANVSICISELSELVKVILDNRSNAQVLKALVRICIIHSEFTLMAGSVMSPAHSIKENQTIASQLPTYKNYMETETQTITQEECRPISKNYQITSDL